jgi:hypothetical protein
MYFIQKHTGEKLKESVPVSGLENPVFAGRAGEFRKKSAMTKYLGEKSQRSEKNNYLKNENLTLFFSRFSVSHRKKCNLVI